MFVINNFYRLYKCVYKYFILEKYGINYFTYKISPFKQLTMNKMMGIVKIGKRR